MDAVSAGYRGLIDQVGLATSGLRRGLNRQGLVSDIWILRAVGQDDPAHCSFNETITIETAQ
jgi:hypothetical protein